MVTMVVSLLLTPLLLGVDPSAPNGEGNAPNENPLLIPGWVHMNYQPFPWEALYGGRWRLDRYDLVSRSRYDIQATNAAPVCQTSTCATHVLMDIRAPPPP